MREFFMRAIILILVLFILVVSFLLNVTFSQYLIDILTSNITTNVSQMIFPNYINISINISVDAISNISINITKINVTGVFSLYPNEDYEVKVCSNSSIEEPNILWCNQTQSIILILNTSDISTYLIEVKAFNDTLNGYLLDKFYSGFLARPKRDDPTLFSCETSDKNLCIFDEKNQNDLAINQNETLKFIAYAFAGATLDMPIAINVSVNVSFGSLQTFFNSTNFNTNEINLRISNFTNLGKYTLTFNFTHSEISYVYSVDVNVYTLNGILSAKDKNYTKVRDKLQIIGNINRTDGNNLQIPSKIFATSKTPDINIADFFYDNVTGNVYLNLTFSSAMRTNITLYFEDELGIGRNFTIYNLTAYDINVNLETPEIAYVGSTFLIKITTNILPDSVDVPFNYTATVDGSCSLVRTYSKHIEINASSVGECSVNVNVNTTYLGLFFQGSKRAYVTIIQSSSSQEGSGAPPISSASILLRAKDSDLYIKRGSYNSTIIFVTSLGRSQNISAYAIDYPSNLILFIPKSQIVNSNEEGIFLVNISVDKNESRNEFYITLLFNSSYARNQTRIKIIVLGELRQVNQSEILEVNLSIQKLEEEVSSVEQQVIKSGRNDLLQYILDIKNKIREAKDDLSSNISKSKQLINESINLLNYVKSELQKVQEQKEVSGAGFNWTLIIIIVVFVVAGLGVFTFFKYVYPKIKSQKVGKPYYDYQRGKFVWSKEDESVWEKLKEKWKRKQ